jgi:hypothetical protein
MRKVIPQATRELLSSPYDGGVGDETTYSVDMGAPVVVDSQCWMHAWKGTRDVSGDVLSGSMSANGNIVTLKTISNELAAEYRYTFRVLVNSQRLVFFFRRKVERESGAK